MCMIGNTASFTRRFRTKYSFYPLSVISFPKDDKRFLRFVQLMCVFLSVSRKREKSEQCRAIGFRVKHRPKTQQWKRFQESKWVARGTKTFYEVVLFVRRFLEGNESAQDERRSGRFVSFGKRGKSTTIDAADDRRRSCVGFCESARRH